MGDSESSPRPPNLQSSFSQFVIDQAPPDRRQIVQNWFIRPDVEMIRLEETENDIPSPPPDPPEVSAKELQRAARAFYEANGDGSGPSPGVHILVLLFVVLFAIPAWLVFFGKCVWRFLKSGKTHLQAQSHWRNYREKVLEYVLYVVYVRGALNQGSGGARAIIAPAIIPSFLHAHVAALKHGKELMNAALLELERLKSLHHIAVLQCRAALQAAAENPPQIPDDPTQTDWNAPAWIDHDAAIQKYRERKEVAESLRLDVEQAKDHLRRIHDAAQSEASAKVTTYSGLADWASDAYDVYSQTMTAVSNIAVVGAGLAYSSIFSATRGDVGLMSWAFSLFVVALSIIVPLQWVLLWCRRLGDYPFLQSRLWNFFVASGIHSAVAALCTAITILVVTVFNLHFNVSSEPYMNPNSANWDARLEFGVNPRNGAIVVFTVRVP
ncbi:hypothetical protein DL93DRAFT_824651 [Clavulina sp. PMI_390]|nr:hypothetical protein DL93DRAFT_824651 [Clavulina sp. PMI_390]